MGSWKITNDVFPVEIVMHLKITDSRRSGNGLKKVSCIFFDHNIWSILRSDVTT
jgi:hypothetical protein